MESVKLIECFRNTFQGEGADSGKRFSLLRFKYCNKKCKYCDTLVKMRISQETEYKLSDLQKMLDEEKTNLMITGGEPTIKVHFNDTLRLLNELTYPLANVESNGFNLVELIEQSNPSKNIHFVYSPKIFTEADLEDSIYTTKQLLNLSNKVFIKVVYEDKKIIADYIEFLSEYVNTLNDSSLYSRIWLMPEGTTRETLIENSSAVLDACEKYKFNFSSREHIIYGFI